MALQWLTDPNIQVNGKTPDDIYINGTQIAHLYKNVKITCSDHTMKMFKNQSIGYEGSEAEMGVGCDPDTPEVPGYRDYYMDIVTGVCIKVETDVTQSDGVRVEKIKISHSTAIKNYNNTSIQGAWGTFEWYPAANDTLATADITQEEFNTLYNTYGEGIPAEKPYYQLWKNFPLYEVTGTSWDNIPAEDWTQTFYTKGWLHKLSPTIYFTDGTTASFNFDNGFQGANFKIDTFFQGNMRTAGSWSK